MLSTEKKLRLLGCEVSLDGYLALVGNTEMKVSNASEYFEHIVAFNVSQYKIHPSSLPAAFNLASCLFSMHEWMWNTYGKALGENLDSAKDFNAHVQAECDAFKYIRDLANASKHISLTSPSTQATHITDTSSIQSKYDEGVYGGSKYGRGVVVINDGDKKVDFEAIADTVLLLWREQLEKLE
jgi:hypothetical protein